MGADKHWRRLGGGRVECPTLAPRCPLPEDMDAGLPLPSFIVFLPGFLGGFGVSSVNAGNGWDRPQKDETITLRLEEHFPKCRKHTTDGIKAVLHCTDT